MTNELLNVCYDMEIITNDLGYCRTKRTVVHVANCYKSTSSLPGKP